VININSSTGEIFLYGIVGGDDYFEDSFSDMEVIKALSQLGSKRAKIRINSPGGVTDQGIAIYNAIKRHPAGADTYNDSLAASAASVIFLAGENRFASKGSRVMIHRAWTFAMGNSSELSKVAETLSTYDKSQAEIYAEYLPEGSNVLAMLDAETWFTSGQAIECGIATGFGEEVGATPQLASWFKNPPASLVRTAFASRKGLQMAKAKRWVS
jgi:ATP-dependent Clp protease protease subunit